MLRVLSLAGAFVLSSVQLASADLQEAASRSAECRDVQDCRSRAEEAAAAGDYETLHDLAWRAVQKGPPRNADLMLLLARAQSLSGRPHDALVMLRRITEIGAAPVDALTGDDFRRVRSLPDWQVLEAAIRAVAAGEPVRPATPFPATAARRATAPAAGPAPGAPAAGSAPAAAPPPASGPGASPAGAPARLAATRASTVLSRPEEALRFASPGPPPGDLAFDRVSGRFLFANTAHRKVTVVGEQSRKAVDLVRAESAGFYDVVAIEIDAQRGDLWVASAGRGEPGSAGAAADNGARGSGVSSAIHKLQLISGRPLATIEAPALDPPVRFADLAVAGDGAVVALDAAGRIWRLPPGARALERVVELQGPEPLALALAGERAYVAREGGVTLIDLARGRADALQANAGVDLSGIRKLRWREGVLVAVQDAPGGRRIVRASLDRSGRRVLDLETLDSSVPGAPAAPALTVSGEDVYYVVPAAAAQSNPGSPEQASADTVVRRLRLR